MEWSNQDIERLPVLWAQGLSAREIGLELDGRYSRNAVIGKARRLGLEARRIGRKAGAKSRRKSRPVFDGIEVVTGDLLIERKKLKSSKPKKRKHTFNPLPPSADTVVSKRATHNGAGLTMRDIKWVGVDKSESALDSDAVPVDQRKSFSDLEERHCRFPYGQPGTPGFFYCGGERVDPCFPYCPMHCRIAYAGAVKPNASLYGFGRKEA